MFRVLQAVSLAVLLLLVGPHTSAWAQRTTATLQGLVVDTSGGILPGVDVELTNEGTGIVDRQVTSATGEFLFNYVPGGSYTLVVSITGFKTVTVQGIALGAAQNVRRRIELEVGSLEESITVSGDAPLINSVSGEQRITLETAELATLPTANRNLTNLLNIGAGLTRQEAVTDGGGAGGTSAGTVRLRLNGLGGAAMSITANGTEASGTAGTRSISTYNGVSKIDIVSIESVGEVNIVKGIVPAEFGNALAGNLNVITKAGSNVPHGSLFHRYEGAGLVAKPFFLKTKPESKWNQGGGSLGGPILRDRAFFFTAFEAYRLKRALEINSGVPTQRFRDALLTGMPFPETRVFLDHYPLPNQPVSATALTGTFIDAGSKENNDDHLDTRVDLRIKGGNLSASFTYGHPFLNQADILPGLPTVFETTSRRASASYAIARGRWSSETRFGYSYNYLSRINPGFFILDPVNPGSIDPNAKNRRTLPMIAFAGLVPIFNEAHIRGQQPSYSFEQQITKVTDKHAFKFGGLYAIPRGGRLNTQGVSFTYLNEADILANRASAAAFRPRDVSFLWANTNWGLFAQDDWRINSKLVLNLGIRYDYFGRFKVTPRDPVDPAGIVNLDPPPGGLDPSFAFGPPRPPDRFIEDDKGINLGPRVGFVYNPDAKGQTVVSGGWGMMFQSMDPQMFEPQVGMTSGIPSVRTFSTVEIATLGLKYPIYNEDMYQYLLATTTPGPLSSVGLILDPHTQAPYAHVFTVGLQRAFGSATVVNAAYLGTRGDKFRMFRTYNEPDRVTGIRPNPALSQARYHDDSQETTYNSLQTSMRQRLSRNLQFNVNYTWSSSRSNFDGDNAGGSVNDEAATVQDFFDIESSWGPAIGDVRHNFIGDVIYSTSGTGWSSPIARSLLGNWQIAGIFRARSGEPLVITQAGRIAARPDVVDGANAVNGNCCDIFDNNMQYLNPAAFQLVPLTAVARQPVRAGNAAVGQFRGPGLKNIDLSLAKYINIGGQKRIELRADILNALNWVNYIALSTNLSAANFGQITGTAAARVAQLQARFSF